MRELSAELEENAETFKTIRKARQAQHEYYFLSQMYEHAWKP